MSGRELRKDGFMVTSSTRETNHEGAYLIACSNGREAVGLSRFYNLSTNFNGA